MLITGISLIYNNYLFIVNLRFKTVFGRTKRQDEKLKSRRRHVIGTNKKYIHLKSKKSRKCRRTRTIWQKSLPSNRWSPHRKKRNKRRGLAKVNNIMQ